MIQKDTRQHIEDNLDKAAEDSMQDQRDMMENTE